jgi:hypothetical protein
MEFMADFYRRSGAEWLPVRPTAQQAVEVDGVMVFVSERGELQAMLTEFGRPKDIERARHLAALA